MLLLLFGEHGKSHGILAAILVTSLIFLCVVYGQAQM